MLIVLVKLWVEEKVLMLILLRFVVYIDVCLMILVLLKGLVLFVLLVFLVVVFVVVFFVLVDVEFLLVILELLLG